MPQYVVRLSICPSVRPSVTFKHRDHIGWNTSKIISRPNSLRHLLTLTPTSAIWSIGNTPKLSGIGCCHEHKKPAIVYHWNGGKIGPRLLWRTNRKSHTRFRWYQNQWPWMTLNGRNVSFRNKKITEPTKKIWTKIDSYYQRQNVGRWF